MYIKNELLFQIFIVQSSKKVVVQKVVVQSSKKENS